MSDNILEDAYQIEVPSHLVGELSKHPDDTIRIKYRDPYCRKCADEKIYRLSSLRQYRSFDERGFSCISYDYFLCSEPLKCCVCGKKLISYVRFDKIVGSIQSHQQWDMCNQFLQMMECEFDKFLRRLDETES